MKKLVLIILTVVLFLGGIPSVIAMEGGEDLDNLKTNKVEKDNKSIDFSKMKVSPVNFVANYQEDLNDLIRQIKAEDTEYKILVEELSSDSISSEQLKEVNDTISRFEDNFKTVATELLSTRYTNDKKQIHPQIIRDFYNAQK